MKTIIAGSRDIRFPIVVKQAIITSGFDITEVVCGGAKGVDGLGESWALQNGIPVKHFPADWSQHGKSAGYKRNVLMGDYADALIAVWDGASKGTNHMINIATKKGLKVYVYKPYHTTVNGRKYYSIAPL